MLIATRYTTIHLNEVDLYRELLPCTATEALDFMNDPVWIDGPVPLASTSVHPAADDDAPAPTMRIISTAPREQSDKPVTIQVRYNTPE